MNELENSWIQDTLKERIKEAEKYAYNQALEDFIALAIEEMPFVCDDFENGMRVGYKYCIEIAEKMKK